MHNGFLARPMVLLRRSYILLGALAPAGAGALIPSSSGGASRGLASFAGTGASGASSRRHGAVFGASRGPPRGGGGTMGQGASKLPRRLMLQPMRMIGSILDILGGGSNELIAPEKALPGRPQKMANIKGSKHYVLGGDLEKVPDGHKVAVFANGCFWGSEKGIWRLPEGIYSTAVGYCAGFTPNPTYNEACSGQTGHTEGVRVVYDPSKISFVDILRWFWEAHDPTSGMGQGNDRGSQYRSGFYYFDDDQKRLIEASRDAYQAQLGRPITTEVAAASDYDEYGGLWYYAEPYHQQYLAKPGARPYCSAQPQGVSLADFDSWAPEDLKEEHAPKLPEAFWAKYAPRRGCSVVQESNEPIAVDSW